MDGESVAARGTLHGPRGLRVNQRNGGKRRMATCAASQDRVLTLLPYASYAATSTDNGSPATSDSDPPATQAMDVLGDVGAGSTLKGRVPVHGGCHAKAAMSKNSRRRGTAMQKQIKPRDGPRLPFRDDLPGIVTVVPFA